MICALNFAVVLGVLYMLGIACFIWWLVATYAMSAAHPYWSDERVCQFNETFSLKKDGQEWIASLPGSMVPGLDDYPCNLGDDGFQREKVLWYSTVQRAGVRFQCGVCNESDVAVYAEAELKALGRTIPCNIDRSCTYFKKYEPVDRSGDVGAAIGFAFLSLLPLAMVALFVVKVFAERRRRNQAMERNVHQSIEQIVDRQQAVELLGAPEAPTTDGDADSTSSVPWSDALSDSISSESYTESSSS